ncbi:MAG: AAA family ATPase [Acidobacteriota bacterium]|nr:AAA family ATPase [Acidobacteriota bacterium]MDE3043787.1 AAA family ATPase [Acidobacteriota bacterium]MDE3108027.1 AAA family ATPase [Acidobacteriota bacterium]MDE3223247.1 AAA family ATPase [Acidobacteriota bacterium]
MPEVLLRELYARALGVISDAHLELAPGFSVITGETGAGKTLLLGALELALGSESPSSRLALTPDTRAVALFERHGEEIVLARESSPNARLRSSINAAPTSAEGLRTLAQELIVIHGQHDSLALRQRSDILRLVDAWGGVDATELDDTRRRLREARQFRDEAGGDAGQRAREREFVEFQLRELASAELTTPAELPDTLRELERLSELRDGQSQLLDVVTELDGDHDEALLTKLARAVNRLPRESAYDDARALLAGALDQARDATRELASLSDPEIFDQQRIDDLDARVALLQALARKYGGSFDQVFAVRDQLHERRQTLLDHDERAQRLDGEIAELEVRVGELAASVRRAREEAAAGLSRAVGSNLERVALANASLRFVVEGGDGSDAQILFSPNPGQGEGPLAALASGGELSRVLLAISLETASPNVVAVFDEIDAGVGGQVAQQIGECLGELAQYQQVLAVTHLASVAACADHHFVVQKEFVDGATKTSVRRVDAEERVAEIARMLAGTINSESRALAARLLAREQGIRS